MPIWRATRALNDETPNNRHHENPPRFIPSSHFAPECLSTFPSRSLSSFSFHGPSGKEKGMVANSYRSRSGRLLAWLQTLGFSLTLKTFVSILVLQRYGLQVTEVMPSDLGNYLGHLLNARDSCEGSGLIPTTSVYSFDSDSRNFLLCSA